MTTKLNVLWLFSDELRTDALSCYGNCYATIATPNLDSLASNGIRYTRHYVSSPVCVSSRYALLTGAGPATTGVYHNDALAIPDAGLALASWTESLRQAGYNRVDFGKSHVPATLTAFDEYHPSGSDWFDLEDAVAEIADPEEVRVGYGAVLAARWPQSRHYPPGELTENVCRFLRDAANEPSPFLCRASFLQPHTPVSVPEPWASTYDDEPWPTSTEDIQQGSLSTFESRYGKISGLAELDPHEFIAVQSRYHGLVRWLDDQIGRILETLRDTGLDKSTVVVFNADHGALLGEARGAMGKMLFAPFSQRVPMIISCPAIVDQGVSDDRLCDSLDFGPTILDMLGLDGPDHLEGQSLLGSDHRDAIFGMIGYGNLGARAISLAGWGTYEGGRGWPQRACIRTDEYRYEFSTRLDGRAVSTADRDPFLANTKDDPEELRNLSHDPAFAERMRNLDERLRSHVDRARIVDDEWWVRPVTKGRPLHE